MTTKQLGRLKGTSLKHKKTSSSEKNRIENLHTLIYAKKQLIGLTKFFVEEESGLNNWKDLKGGQCDEPNVTRTCAEFMKPWFTISAD
ncbi:hypothetical protein QE152_g35922 [Popillia japonica]|uniref:Uncharacterized protein n=1 Tax=Popillia japonica TaxID=7064 RepID=A0AAW1IEG9_POPJA